MASLGGVRCVQRHTRVASVHRAVKVMAHRGRRSYDSPDKEAAMRRALLLTLMAMTLSLSPARAGELDRAAVDFKTPSEIAWIRNAASTNEQAVLFGDPSKPGPYVVRIKWLPGNMSRPHFHPNDRFFVVLSGTWWMGTGENFDPEGTVPAPAGSYVRSEEHTSELQSPDHL